MDKRIQKFFANEIEELHKNVDRIQNHLTSHQQGTAYSGQSALLSVQKEHLAIIEDLSHRITSYDDMVSYCKKQVLQSEDLHTKIARREQDRDGWHSAEWWNSLHRIQFWVDLLNRSKVWCTVS